MTDNRRPVWTSPPFRHVALAREARSRSGNGQLRGGDVIRQEHVWRTERAHMGEVETTASVVMVDWADVEHVRTTAAGHGVEVQVVETKGIDPLSTTTLVLVGVPLAVGTVTQLLDRVRGGQVIDLRPGAEKALYRTKDVVY